MINMLTNRKFQKKELSNAINIENDLILWYNDIRYNVLKIIELRWIFKCLRKKEMKFHN